MKYDLGQLADTVIMTANGSERFLVAIAGPPGAGKSTLAAALATRLCQGGMQSVVVPMDGFHLDNAILDARGVRERKGSPQTFDAIGLHHLLTRLSHGEAETVVPLFDRERDVALAGAMAVTAADRIVIVEGNYLLLKDEPWNRMHASFGLTIFIEPEMQTLRARLIQRWLDHGHDPDAAVKRAAENDLPNARLVLERSIAADFTIRE